MDYFLTEEQAMIRDLARQIAEDKILPVRAELDEKEEFNLGVWIGQFHNKNGRCWDAAEDIVNRTLNSTEHKLTRPSIDP